MKRTGLTSPQFMIMPQWRKKKMEEKELDEIKRIIKNKSIDNNICVNTEDLIKLMEQNFE